MEKCVYMQSTYSDTVIMITSIMVIQSFSIFKNFSMNIRYYTAD